MSVVPIGYANLTTSCFEPAGSGGGGGGAGTFTSITFPAAPGGVILSDSLQDTYDESGNGNRVKVYSSVTGQLGPMYVGGELTVQDVGQVANEYNRMNYRPSSVVWQQASTGASFPFMTVDTAKNGFDLTGILSINGSPPLTGDVPLVQSGSATYTGPGTVVYFPKPFASPPQVFLQPTSAFGIPDGTLYIQYQSFGGESLFMVNSTGSSNMLFYWMAVGV